MTPDEIKTLRESKAAARDGPLTYIPQGAHTISAEEAFAVALYNHAEALLDAADAKNALTEELGRIMGENYVLCAQLAEAREALSKTREVLGDAAFCVECDACPLCGGTTQHTVNCRGIVVLGEG